MRIRILHTFFYPDKSSVSQIIGDVAFHLAAQGHQVDVIASRGVYEGGKRLPAVEEACGVLIRRVWSPSLGKKSILTRLADLVCYSVGSLVMAMASLRADKVVVLTNPPMYALVGVLLKLFKAERYVYVLMDLYPDVAVRAGLLRENGLVARLARRLTRLTFRHAETIVTLGTCMARAVENYGINVEKIKIVRNWAFENDVSPLPPEQNPLRKEMGYKDEFVVMYSGNMGVTHRFDDILQSAVNLRHRDDIRFLFVGGGVRRKEIETFAERHNLSSVTVRDYFPRDKLGMSLPLGDAHFVSLAEGFEGLVVPSKAYGIMAAGRPIIYQGSGEGEIARMLREEGGGEVVPQGDADRLTEIITIWASDRSAARAVGLRAREVFERGYTERIGLRHYQEILEG